MRLFRLLVLESVGLLLLLLPAGAQEAPFYPMRDALPDLRSAAVAWGDYDGDGDLDLALSGMDAGGAAAAIHRNLGDTLYYEEDARGEFILVMETRYRPVYPVAPPLGQGDVAWGDYDRDGDLDLLIAGRGAGGRPAAGVYENRGQDGFAPAAALEGVHSGAVAWGDYDGDGDLDALLCGIDGVGAHRTLLYENQRGAFMQRDAGLPGLANGDAAWADYDGDGDLDLVLTGIAQPQAFITRLYRNAGGGTFTPDGADLEGLLYASADWGDYDNDGDPDLLLSGARLSPFVLEGVLRVYENHGGVFTARGDGLRGAYHGGAGWGDYDNDGDLDVLVAGGTHPYQAATTAPLRSRLGRLYLNGGGGRLTEGSPVVEFGGGFLGDAIWGDYDGDGDLDFLVTGQRSTETVFTDVWRNERPASGTLGNLPPTPPADLAAAVEGGLVRLSWAAASDRETPPAGLSYNLRVGTVPGGTDVVAPMSAAATGQRLIPAPGNAGQGTQWTLRGLPPGRYFWSLQAVDHSFQGSPFAEEQTFVVTP